MLAGETRDTVKYSFIITTLNYLNDGTGNAWAGQFKLMTDTAALVSLDPSSSDENLGNDPPIGSKK